MACHVLLAAFARPMGVPKFARPMLRRRRFGYRARIRTIKVPPIAFGAHRNILAMKHDLETVGFTEMDNSKRALTPKTFFYRIWGLALKGPTGSVAPPEIPA